MHYQQTPRRPLLSAFLVLLTLTSPVAGASTGVPVAPSEFYTWTTNAKIGLVWHASVGAEAYHVWRSRTYGAPGVLIATTTTPSYTDLSVANGTTYFYEVTASGAAGTSAHSAQLGLTAGVPLPPATIGANAESGAVALTWAPSTGATSYRVRRSTSLGAAGTVIAAPTSGSYTDKAVVDGTTYYYQVAAVGAGGASGYCKSVNAKPHAPSAIPVVPTGVKATAGNGVVTLSWSASSGTTVYDVLRSTTAGTPGALIAQPSSTSYTDSAVINGTTYYYELAAAGAGGTSANSAQVSAKPTAVTPPPVSPPPVSPPPVSPPPVSPPPGTSWVYYNGTFYWPGDWSWGGGTPNYQDTSGGPLSGAYDIKFGGTGTWSGWLPYAPNKSFDTTGYKYLVISLKPTVANQDWNLYAELAGDTQTACGLGPMLSKYGTITVGQWTNFKIPLADLCIVNTQILKFGVQDQTGLNTNYWYIDNVGFEP